MDSERFDQLTKALATGATRRRFLGGLLSTALTGLGVRNASAQTACPRETPIRCGDTCADLRADPTNCGRCGNACGGRQVCYAGRCSNACPRGFEACNGTCHRACDSGQVHRDDCTCCTPSTCASVSAECGAIPDGCGGMLDCGSCSVETGLVCAENTCVVACAGTLEAAGCTFLHDVQRWDCGVFADLAGANLAGCDLTGTVLDHANLSAADLSDALLVNASLVQATLSDALLVQAELGGADLTLADLTRATLSGTNLSGANATKAILTDAHLNDANLSSVTWSDTTCPNDANSGISSSATCCGHLLPGDIPSAGCD